MGCTGSKPTQRNRSREKSVKSRSKKKNRSSISRGPSVNDQSALRSNPKQSSQIIDGGEDANWKQPSNDVSREVVQVRPSRPENPPVKNDEQSQKEKGNHKQGDDDEYNHPKVPSEKDHENKQLRESSKNLNPESSAQPSKANNSRQYPSINDGSYRLNGRQAQDPSSAYNNHIVEELPSKKFSKIEENREEIVMVESYMDFGQTTIKNPSDMKIVMNL